jgi:hypothetical protein
MRPQANAFSRWETVRQKGWCRSAQKRAYLFIDKDQIWVQLFCFILRVVEVPESWNADTQPFTTISHHKTVDQCVTHLQVEEEVKQMGGRPLVKMPAPNLIASPNTTMRPMPRTMLSCKVKRTISVTRGLTSNTWCARPSCLRWNETRRGEEQKQLLSAQQCTL